MIREQVLEHMAMMRARKQQLVKEGMVEAMGGRPIKARCERDYKAVPRRYCRCNACRFEREEKRGLRGIPVVQTKARKRQVARDGGHLVAPIGLEMRNMLEQWVERVKGMGLTHVAVRIVCGKKNYGRAGVSIDLE